MRTCTFLPSYDENWVTGLQNKFRQVGICCQLPYKPFQSWISEIWVYIYPSFIWPADLLHNEPAHTCNCCLYSNSILLLNVRPCRLPSILSNKPDNPTSFYRKYIFTARNNLSPLSHHKWSPNQPSQPHILAEKMNWRRVGLTLLKIFQPPQLVLIFCLF